MELTSKITNEENISKEVKVKWIKALESGKYKQCTGSLTKDSGYCCLGVFGKINKGEIPTLHQPIYDFCDEKFGMSLRSFCMNANDSLGCSFKEIAETLRGYWDIWE